MPEDLVDQNGFTKTQWRILQMLGDGRPHHRLEVITCLDDELASDAGLRMHISRLRDRLPEGQDVISRTVNRARHYQWVRLICSANDGRK